MTEVLSNLDNSFVLNASPYLECKYITDFSFPYKNLNLYFNPAFLILTQTLNSKSSQNVNTTNS